MNRYAQTKILPCQKGKFEKQDCGLAWLYWNSLKSMAGLKRLLWGLIHESTDHQSGMLTITLNCQLWDTEKLVIDFSHAWLVLVEFT